jgi:hypothetical protein
LWILVILWPWCPFTTETNKKFKAADRIDITLHINTSIFFGAFLNQNRHKTISNKVFRFLPDALLIYELFLAKSDEFWNRFRYKIGLFRRKLTKSNSLTPPPPSPTKGRRINLNPLNISWSVNTFNHTDRTTGVFRFTPAFWIIQNSVQLLCVACFVRNRQMLTW